MSLPRYPEYKDTGKRWLGMAPTHWVVKRLSSLAQILAGYPFDASSFGVSGTPVIRMSDFSNGKINVGDAKRISSEITPPESLAQPGDILLGLSGSITNFAIVESADLPVAINQRVAMVRADVEEAPLVAWLLQSQGFIQQIEAELPATTIQNISMGQLRACQFQVPPSIEEQTAIAAFLDRETAKIDALIAEQEKLIALLAEKRQATISHAVTRGLNPDAPMKDSGVAWLGEVPAHWEVRSISSLSTKITNGYVGPTRDILVDDGVRYLQSLHIKGGRIIFGTPYYVSEAWSTAHEKSILAVGDVLIVQTGDIGQVAVVTEEFSGCNCHALIIVSPIASVLGGEWLSLVLNSSFGFHSLLSIQTGALHPHLNCGNVKDLYLPVPPVEEQREIVAFVGMETTKLDALCSSAQHAVVLLKERRSALISAAVTGQIDVRGLAPEEFEVLG